MIPMTALQALAALQCGAVEQQRYAARAVGDKNQMS
jgi:hypothetical protein